MVQNRVLRSSQIGIWLQIDRIDRNVLSAPDRKWAQNGRKNAVFEGVLSKWAWNLTYISDIKNEKSQNLIKWWNWDDLERPKLACAVTGGPILGKRVKNCETGFNNCQKNSLQKLWSSFTWKVTFREVHFVFRKLKGSILSSLSDFSWFYSKLKLGPLRNDLAAWFDETRWFYWILDVKFLRETTRGQKRSKGSKRVDFLVNFTRPSFKKMSPKPIQKLNWVLPEKWRSERCIFVCRGRTGAFFVQN